MPGLRTTLHAGLFRWRDPRCRAGAQSSLTALVLGSGRWTRQRPEARISGLLLCWWTAGGRNDPVHAQVLDHLAVVVEAVADLEGCHSAPGRLTGTEWALDHAGKSGFRGERRHRFVHVREAVLKKFHDVGFGRDRVRAALALADVHRWLGFAKDGGADHVVRRGDVLHLLGKSANALELALGGSE